MAPLNIAFLNSIETSVWGGLENWMELCGTGLADRGYGVFMTGRPDSKFLDRISKYENLTTIPLPISGDFNPATIGALAAHIKNHHIEIVLCNFVKDVRLAGLARAFGAKTKIIWTPGVNLAKKSLSHRLLFSKFVDRVIVPSRHLRGEIVNSGYIDRAHFDILPIGIDETLWQGNHDEGRAFILAEYDLPADAVIAVTSGRFVPQKGHTHLIEAANSLKDTCDKLHVLFLGDGPLEAELKQQINDYELNDRFTFCGLLERHQRVLFGADICVHPAVIEPFGIVLVEAMAASLPVIACRVGGIPEVVAENESALLVEPARPDELTTAIESLYTDITMRKKLGEAGFTRYQERFQKGHMIDGLEKILREAVSS